MAVASMMCAFGTCHRPCDRFLGGLSWSNSRSPDGHNSLLVGKKAGNFSQLASFLRNPSPKQLQIQLFANEFPTDGAGNYFMRAGNYFGFSTGAGNFAQNRSASHSTKANNQQSRYAHIEGESFCCSAPPARGCAAMQP
jgi:hypothetical protein